MAEKSNTTTQRAYLLPECKLDVQEDNSVLNVQNNIINYLKQAHVDITLPEIIGGEGGGIGTITSIDGMVPDENGHISTQPYEKVLLYYGFPIAIKNVWNVPDAMALYAQYDLVVLGDTYQWPTHETYDSTCEIIRQIRAGYPNTKVAGYVPIGCLTLVEEGAWLEDPYTREIVAEDLQPEIEGIQDQGEYYGQYYLHYAVVVPVQVTDWFVRTEKLQKLKAGDHIYNPQLGVFETITEDDIKKGGKYPDSYIYVCDVVCPKTVQGAKPITVGLTLTYVNPYRSNLPLEEVKAEIDLWANIGCTGIFLDEYGYDYRVTRKRQNDIISYCHAKGLFVIANSWDIAYVFDTEVHPMEWLPTVEGGIVDPNDTSTMFQANPLQEESFINGQDYYLYENLFWSAVPNEEWTEFTMQCSDPFRIDDALRYYSEYYDKFKTKLITLDAIANDTDEITRKQMMSISAIGTSILNIHGLGLGDEYWGSAGDFYEWDIPNIKAGKHAIVVENRLDLGTGDEFPSKWSASIGGVRYSLHFDIDTVEDLEPNLDKRYVTINGTKVNNAWLTVYDLAPENLLTPKDIEQFEARIDSDVRAMRKTVDKLADWYEQKKQEEDEKPILDPNDPENLATIGYVQDYVQAYVDQKFDYLGEILEDILH